KEKLFNLATTSMNENCSAVILQKLPEKLGDPGKFHFPTDFVVVDYVVDPRVPLILGRPFLRTGRALIDIYGEDLTLHVDDEAITFKVGQTLKYSYNDAESINQIEVIDVACEEYVQEILGFYDNSKIDNPTPISDPIIPKGGDFILEEIEACLISESILPGIDDTDLDLEGDIHLLEELLNNNPSLSPPSPKELNVKEIKTVKSSIDEPSELELKELPSHLEYAYLEGTDKLLVIIAKGLKDNEKEAILKVLKSHKRAIAWKIIDIKDCIDAFETLKKKLTEASILVVPDWNLPFKLMCDASDFAIGAVLGQQISSGEIKVHIEVLSMLWGNRLPILDGSLPLSSLLKGRGSPGQNKTPGPWSARIPMWRLFNGLGGNGYDKSGQNRSKTDKTGHGNEKSSRYRSRRRIHLKSNPVNSLS
nr:reverse transcriptase domain-containing protein [Tanacetum cinerariifolium]